MMNGYPRLFFRIHLQIKATPFFTHLPNISVDQVGPCIHQSQDHAIFRLHSENQRLLATSNQMWYNSCLKQALLDASTQVFCLFTSAYYRNQTSAAKTHEPLCLLGGKRVSFTDIPKIVNISTILQLRGRHGGDS